MFEIRPERDRLVIGKLKDHFNDQVLAYERLYDMLTITLKKDLISHILRFLFKEEELDYKFLTTLCGMHYPKQELQLGVVYHLHSFSHNHRIRIKVFTSIEDPVIMTATTIWETANWMERETFDFYGIIFEGHPNLKRILNEDDFEGFPMRKEFPLEDQTREDKNDAMFGREA